MLEIWWSMSMCLSDMLWLDIWLSIDMPMDGCIECWMPMLVEPCNWFSGAAAEAPRTVESVAKTFMLIGRVGLCVQLNGVIKSDTDSEHF